VNPTMSVAKRLATLRQIHECEPLDSTLDRTTSLDSLPRRCLALSFDSIPSPRTSSVLSSHAVTVSSLRYLFLPDESRTPPSSGRDPLPRSEPSQIVDAVGESCGIRREGVVGR